MAREDRNWRRTGARSVRQQIADDITAWADAGHIGRHRPAEPLARDWRAGDADRQARWRALSFADRAYIYRQLDKRYQKESPDA